MYNTYRDSGPLWGVFYNGSMTCFRHFNFIACGTVSIDSPRVFHSFWHVIQALFELCHLSHLFRVGFPERLFHNFIWVPVF